LTTFVSHLVYFRDWINEKLFFDGQNANIDFRASTNDCVRRAPIIPIDRNEQC